MPIAIGDIAFNHMTVENPKAPNKANGALPTPQPTVLTENQLSFPKSESQVKVDEIKTSQSQDKKEAELQALPAKGDEGPKHVNGITKLDGELNSEIFESNGQAQQPTQAISPTRGFSGLNVAPDQDKAGAIAPPPLTVEEKINKVLKVLTRYQINNTAKKVQWLGKDHVAAQLRRFVEQDNIIRLVLPAFPFKSPNKISKVLGSFPDKAEEVALAHLNGLCVMIKEIHAPGAEVLIVSDGLMYSGLVPHDIASLQAADVPY